MKNVNILELTKITFLTITMIVNSHNDYHKNASYDFKRCHQITSVYVVICDLELNFPSQNLHGPRRGVASVFLRCERVRRRNPRRVRATVRSWNHPCVRPSVRPSIHAQDMTGAGNDLPNSTLVGRSAGSAPPSEWLSV